jgi:hemolysin III
MAALLVFIANGSQAMIAAAIYGLSLSALLGTSAAYHRINWTPKARAWMRRLDHTMIFVLIAGTYTPFGMLKLGDRLGFIVLVSMWSAVGAGVVLKLVWLSAPKWLVAILYVATGWMSVWVAPEMIAATGVLCVTLIGIGGALYTVGALIYAMKRPNPIPGVFGYHEVFHALVIAAALVHYIAIAIYVLPTC